MDRPRLLLLSAAGVLLVAVLSAAWIGAIHATATAEITRWNEAQRGARALLLRLDRLPVSRQGAPLPDHVATLARRVLVTAGVGQDALAGIQPLGDTVLPGGAWHRQQVLLQLRGLSTRQAAAIVDAVARTDPAWAVASIQLSHAGGGTGSGDTYDTGLALTTLYPAQP